MGCKLQEVLIFDAVYTHDHNEFIHHFVYPFEMQRNWRSKMTSDNSDFFIMRNQALQMDLRMEMTRWTLWGPIRDDRQIKYDL